MIREYLKLARSFNAVLTALSPPLGAIAMEQYNIFILLILFLIGFLGHTFGFVFNDIRDYKIDLTSKEISDRPLISGTISMKNAWIFALSSLILAFVLAFFIAYNSQIYYPILVLAISAAFTTIYDLVGKKFVGSDIFLPIGVFFFVLYGAATTVDNISKISTLAWIVCFLGFLQVLFMATICGSMKDIENDYNRGAKTIAIRLGGRVTNGRLIISSSFKALAYGIQLVDLIVVFLPYLIVWNIYNLTIFQFLVMSLIAFVGIIMYYFSFKLVTLKRFERDKVRKFIGLHYITNFMIVPIMLMSLNPWAGVIIIFPLIGFFFSNIILHGTLLQPKTM